MAEQHSLFLLYIISTTLSHSHLHVHTDVWMCVATVKIFALKNPMICLHGLIYLLDMKVHHKFVMAGAPICVHLYVST